MDDEYPISFSPPRRRPPGHLTVTEKTLIINIIKTYTINHPEKNKVETVRFTSQAAGVSLGTVYKILSEYKSKHAVDPPKEYYRPRAILDHVDEDSKNAIRRKFHAFLLRNESPIYKEVQKAIKKDKNIPILKKGSFLLLLNELGLRINSRLRSNRIVEKTEITERRRKYLQEIRTIRESNKKIYYLDVTLLNSTVGRGGRIMTTKQAFLKGLSTNDTQRQNAKRFVILHIGSEDGFVENGLFLFESKMIGGANIDSNIIESWLKHILPRLQPDCVIVLDNAPCYSRRLERELLQMDNEPTNYAVDQMATDSKRTILRIPEHHCELNPIEYIWAQIKDEVNKKKCTFTEAHLQILYSEAIKNVTGQSWRNAFAHVIQLENSMWEIHNCLDMKDTPTINEDYNSSSSLDSN